MIELKSVRFRWPDEPVILENLSLRIDMGQKVVLLGANGCGKSTLLKLMNGLIEPESGEVYWQGQALTREALRRDAHGKEFRRRCALLFQHPEAMLFNPTVRDELAYGPRQLGLADTDRRVNRWADELGLAPLLDKPHSCCREGRNKSSPLAVFSQWIRICSCSTSLQPVSIPRRSAG
jgi:cobalt/nickel transport system ATP-binding protein